MLRTDATTPKHELVVANGELAAGGHSGRHTHPGDEIGYVTESEGELAIDGEPAKRLKAGHSFVVKAGKVHDMRNPGKAPLHLVVRSTTSAPGIRGRTTCASYRWTS